MFPETPFFDRRLGHLGPTEPLGTPVPEQTYEDREHAQRSLNPARNDHEAAIPKVATRGELEDVNDVLGRALSALEQKDIREALALVEEARDLVYRHLR